MGLTMNRYLVLLPDTVFAAHMSTVVLGTKVGMLPISIIRATVVTIPSPRWLRFFWCGVTAASFAAPFAATFAASVTATSLA
jgi:hypothetical protein